MKQRFIPVVLLLVLGVFFMMTLDINAEEISSNNVSESEVGNDTSSLLTNSSASSGLCGEDVRWSLDEEGVLTISGTGDMYSVINVWHYNKEIVEVVIESGITSISQGAFMDCISLKEVTIPGSVTYIREGAFYGCSGLKSVSIPEGITYIDSSVFRDCINLVNIELPETVNYIGNHAFENCKSLTSLTIPGSVSDIRYNLCKGSGIETVRLNEGVEVIRQEAFSNCDKLMDFTMPESLTTIENYAFENSNKDTVIIIPKSVRDIEVYAFYKAPILGVYYNSDAYNHAVFYNRNHLIIGDNYLYEKEVFEDNKILLNKYMGNDSSIEIPAQIDGFKVSSIRCEIFKKNSQVMGVKIPKNVSVTYIVDEVYEFDDNLILTVYEGSAAYEFAQLYDIKCQIIEDWDNGIVIKEPTCVETGEKLYTCMVCGKTKTEEIEATGHIWDENYSIDVKPTCLAEGEKSIHCIKCGTKQENSGVIIEKTDHNWSDWEIIKIPSVISKGLEGRKCEICGEKEEREISKLEDRTDITYRTHVADYGWQDWRSNGAMSGTSGQAKRLEAIQIELVNQGYTGNIEYRTHVADYGWQDWRSNGTMSGTSGQAKRLEAIQVRLTGEIAEWYNIYYRVHAEYYGWMDWAKDGGYAGTSGYARRLEAIEICLVKKGEAAPGNTKIPYRHPMVKYQTHVADYGWQDWRQDGAMSGTTGQAKRLEGIKIQLANQEYQGNIEYQTHVEDYGWQSWVKNGGMSGTTGQAKRLEAIQIRLTAEMGKNYDIYYRVHAEEFGWLGWAKNGQPAGTEGYARRLEGIEIRIVEKGAEAPGSTKNSFYQRKI